MLEFNKILEMDFTKASVRDLNEAVVRLKKAQWKEYTTRGNTARSQMLFKRFEEAEKEIDRRLK